VSDGPDLSHFVQHRQLDAYEQSMARQTYAYGVDLRRSRWLASSSLGNPLVRAVDRAWPTLAGHLMQEAFVPAERAGGATTELLAELATFMQLLRAPLPTVRLVRPEQRGRWPLVTPLGATRGGALWLALDAEALLALEPSTRAFLVGSGLGHLHCDHGVYFTAHLLAGRREGNAGTRTVRALMTPWTGVLAFSADRAGLLCCGSLERAIAVLEDPPVPVGEGAAEAEPSWWPRFASTAERVRALQEFARSTVFARLSAMRARQRDLARERGLDAALREGAPALDAEPGEPIVEPSANEPPPPHVPEDAWSLARVDARLTARLRLL
jgi:hypothetical protein